MTKHTLQQKKRPVTDKMAALIDELGRNPGEVAEMFAVGAQGQWLSEFPSDDEQFGVTIFDGVSPLTSIGAAYQVDVMIPVVDYLLTEHHLLDTITLPYVPRGERALINWDAKNPDGSKMKGEKSLAGGLWLQTNYDKQDKARRIRDVAAECGLTVGFSDAWDAEL